ncbi:MAG: histidinol-phosphate aminotransferase family protein [archaeon]|nr:histidinol-phosphate aminotransferase family protein [archaeon]
MEITPRKELSALGKTVHGGQAWRLEGIEDYSQNLNPLGPPPGIADVMVSAVDALGHYPDAGCEKLKKALADYYGLSPENVIIGAGSSEIIRNFPFAFIEPGESVLIPKPGFAEYTQQCRLAGAEIDNYILARENDFHIDVNALFEQLDSKHYKALYICNPNNPTGRVENKETLVRIIRHCEEIGTMVFLDETLLALVRNYDSISLISMINDFTNLIIADSFTKSFAIPGMRVGFAFTSPEIAAEMEKVMLPWNIGTIEQAVARRIVTTEMDYMFTGANILAKESEVLHFDLAGLGFPVTGVSDSFFYFVPIDELKLTGERFCDMMLKEGIMVRNCSSFGPEYANYVRFCVKDRERNQKFVEAVKKVLTSLEG